MVQQIYQLTLGWGHRKGGSGWQGRRNKLNCVRVDLATVMEWHFERAWCGGKGEGFMTLWRQAGVRWSATSFLPRTPSSCMEGAELQRRGKVCKANTGRHIPHLCWLLVLLTANVKTPLQSFCHKFLIPISLRVRCVFLCPKWRWAELHRIKDDVIALTNPPCYSLETSFPCSRKLASELLRSGSSD